MRAACCLTVTDHSSEKPAGFGSVNMHRKGTRAHYTTPDGDCTHLRVPMVTGCKHSLGLSGQYSHFQYTHVSHTQWSTNSHCLFTTHVQSIR